MFEDERALMLDEDATMLLEDELVMVVDEEAVVALDDELLVDLLLLSLQALALDEALLVIVVVKPVTEHPVVVTVVVGEHFVVEIVELPNMLVVGLQTTVTLSAVVDEHADEELDDELDELLEVSVLVSLDEEDLSSSSSVRSSAVEVRVEMMPSIPSTSFPSTSWVTFSKSSPMQVNVLTNPSMKPKMPLFFLEPQPDVDDLPPRSEITVSISVLTSSTLLSVSVLSEVGLDFQELRMGMRAKTSEETEDALDEASVPERVVVTGGRVIGAEAPSPMMFTVRVIPDSTTVEVTMLGVPTMTHRVDELLPRVLPDDVLLEPPVGESLVTNLVKEELGIPGEEGLTGVTDEELLLVLIMLLDVPELVELAKTMELEEPIDLEELV
ncbi:hypothetical protein N7526_007583 [Penicillium atrosanguineum]|nr:hypothetical protein N7526_007583 [Penicillium atrosanguineum]